MTVFRLRLPFLHFAPWRDSPSLDAGSYRRDGCRFTRMTTDGVGYVEAGSLEEEIWRELGALPESRKMKFR